MIVRLWRAGQRLWPCGAARRAHPVRFVATLGIALAILASLTLAVPRNATSAAPPGMNGAASLSGGQRFESANKPYAFSFPRDHAAHFGYQSEWWYYTGHVRSKSGRRFGYELTFFRIGLRPGDPTISAGRSAWRGNELYPAHFALTDENGKTFVHYERFAREALGAGYSSSTSLDVRADSWSLHGSSPFVLRAAGGGDAIAFSLVAQKPPAVHGHAGISKKAACGTCASHYYSMTRLATRGTLVHRGEKFAIDGITWMDHEFGSDELQSNQSGWDWYSIQLDDRRELMIYSLRQKDGSITPQSSGSLIERDGRVTYLSHADFVTESTGSWKSPHTGGTYPSGWRVRVARANVDLVLAPTVLDQELANTAGGVSYWEGSVDVRDARTQRALGVGYVELTGYAGAISL